MATDILSPNILAGALASFFLGAMPFGYVFVRLFLKKDIRTEGSGNIGATNVARVAGKKLGILTLLLDITKGMICVGTAHTLDLSADTSAVWGLCAFLGHCFTPFLKIQWWQRRGNWPGGFWSFWCLRQQCWFSSFFNGLHHYSQSESRLFSGCTGSINGHLDVK